MKTINAIAAAILLSTSTVANAQLDMGMCEQLNGLARDIMTRRQQGVEMVVITKAFATVLAEHAPVMDSRIMPLITGAYDTPRYHTPDMQQRAITEYANEIYVECVKLVTSRN